MSAMHSEKAFEAAIEENLHKNGWNIDNGKTYDRVRALNPVAFIEFLKSTQPKEWKRAVAHHGDTVEEKVITRFQKEVEHSGMLHVLRNGFTDMGVKFEVAHFRPVSGMNEDAQALYEANLLHITRQLHYSTKNENSLDIVLFLNGIPLATIEVKNQFTGQTVENAKTQYREDRDPSEIIFQFNQRALVHFSVDTDNVYMTTRLKGKDTKHLPFNKGFENGAGNPSNPNGHKTAYLWEEVLIKDSWMDLLKRFLHLEKIEYKSGDTKTIKETLIFPRYHQLDCVRKLIEDARDNGPGKNYLIQHSAGSGKSNSIMWLVYHLASLHKNDKPVYDQIIVITDRTVLDQQLQKTIYEFEHKHGVVTKIDKNSTQLAKELTEGTKILITTLQKFPYVLEKIQDVPKRNYAVIVDEAHSSQGGESSRKLKQVLSLNELDKAEEADEEPEDDYEDQIREVMASRKQRKNVGFFAFTATPKPKTLEVFGTKDAEGKPAPFHLYSMRQAIEEGFIIDVLLNYTTYAMFYRLGKAVQDDPTVPKKSAKRAIARFVSFHPHNIAQKTEVMIEHFRQHTMKRIGGQARAMVVTSSRAHVIRYKHAFDDYIKEKNYQDIHALVAFSGTVKDGEDEYTEVGMNDFGEKELPEKFRTGEYRLLIVANKYQTGYDEPLLHTMYVDKKLHGIKAVQTFSRLNRTHPGKEDTFILDFTNKAKEIQESFQPYYEQTILSESVEPNKLYDIKNSIENFHVVYSEDIEGFCKVFFKAQDKLSTSDHAQLNRFIDPASKRFVDLKPESQEEFKGLLDTYIRLYSFASQVMPFEDIELEKLYVYTKMLIAKLPKRNMADQYKLADEVALEYYRLEKREGQQIELEKGKVGELEAGNERGTKKEKEEHAALSEIIEMLNKRFGTDFKLADRLFFAQIEEDLSANETLREQARTNTKENFQYGFRKEFDNVVVDRMEQNQEIFARIMDDEKFKDAVLQYLLRKVYRNLQEEAK